MHDGADLDELATVVSIGIGSFAASAGIPLHVGTANVIITAFAAWKKKRRLIRSGLFLLAVFLVLTLYAAKWQMQREESGGESSAVPKSQD